jgi:FtsH-binding integral membrane protein
MDRIITSSRDRTSLLSTHKVLRNTYFLLSLTLAFSAITATASTVLMLPSPGLILTLVGMYGLMFLTYKTANSPAGIFLLSPLPVSWVISWAPSLTRIFLRAWAISSAWRWGGPRWCSSVAQRMY